MHHVLRRMNIFARKMLKVSRLRNLKGFAKLCIPNTIKVALVNCHWALTICTSPTCTILLVCPPKFCISFVFNFYWVLQSSQDKLKTMAMQHFGGKTILGDVQMANCTFGHTELTSKIYLSDHQIIGSQCAISQCSKQPLLNQVYLVVHFYPWYKPYFPLFHTLPLTSKQRKIKFQPRITLSHNLYTKEECV